MAVIAIAAAILAIPADAHPTGWLPFDAILRSGLAALVVVSAARRGPWAVTWSAAITSLMLAVATSPAAAAATLALGGMAALIAVGERDPLLQALAGAAVVEVALRLHWQLATGASIAAGVIALAPLLLAGLATASPRTRRLVRWTAAGCLVFAFVGGALGGLAALHARSAVDRGVRAARDGLTALGRDDRDAARRDFDDAAAAFAEAHDTLAAPWARPAYAVPIAAQQIRAVNTLAGSGGDLASTASKALGVADPRTIRPEGGQVDLDAVRRLQAPLDDVLRVLQRSKRRLDEVGSPWLVTAVADRYNELTAKVDRALAQADVAADAARLAPDLLGATEARRYLLAVYTPAESRGGGGFMGNYGELTADQGKLTLAKFGRIKELDDGGDPEHRTITGVPEYVANWGAFHPERFWGAIDVTNDFPTAANVMRQLYPQSGGSPVDGVIQIDPDGFAALLQLTGPLTVTGWPEPLTPQNARQVLLHDQYVAFAEDSRVDFLGDASHLLFDRLTSGSLPGVGTMANALGPVVEGRHLQLESARPEEQALFEKIRATGKVPAVQGDSIGFTGQNYDGNKIDWFLHRDATYDVNWNPDTGEVRSTLSIRLRNDAPATGEPHAVIGWGGDTILNQIPIADGENLMLMTVYSALPPTSFAVDGAPIQASHFMEFGRYATQFYVRVPPSSTSTVTLQFDGSLKSDEPYALVPIRQPMANPDTLTVHLEVPSGWRLRSPTDLRTTSATKGVAEWKLDEDHAATVDACRSSAAVLDRLRGC